MVYKVVYAFIGSFLFVYMAMDLPVYAQTVLNTVGGGGVDFTPLANNIITAAAFVASAAVTVVVPWIIRFFNAKTMMLSQENERALAERADEIFHRAINSGEMWLKQQVADEDSPITHVKLNNRAMEIMVQYAEGAMPDIIKYFKWTEAGLQARIMSRLNDRVPIPIANSGKVKFASQAAAETSDNLASAPMPQTAQSMDVKP